MAGRRTAVIAGLLVAGLVVAFAARALAADDPARGGEARTISVSSTATVKEAPDEAVIVLAVRAEEPDSAAAFSRNAQDMQRVLDGLRAAGIADRDIRTLQVGLSQRTVARRTPDEHRVFVATNTVEITIRDLDSVGGVIDTAVKAGADSVNDIRFQLSDPGRIRTDALTQAVEGARSKADALAAAAGAQVVRVNTIEEGNVRIPFERAAYAYDLALPGAAASTPVIAPDSLETSVTVQVVWEIG